ncbi:MAG: isoprenyl transferase [Alphaproteobacteria bacterium]|nr:isoprenyl transferase [Alphaproteobacteria bacterium]
MIGISESQNLRIPEHIAIIMDGNGRWAQRHGFSRTAGHKKGAEALQRLVRLVSETGVRYLTVFGFSSENWSRPEAEVKELMKLLRYYLRSETAELHKSNIRLRVIGDRSAFDADIVQLIHNAEKLTAGNKGITVIMALNYGGKFDIAQAARRLAAQAVETGFVPSTQEVLHQFDAHLMTSGVPDPDLLIRTSGEQRISNFLLWQCAYAEFFFTETLWPDFDRSDLDEALSAYARRERRFGAVLRSSSEG